MESREKLFMENAFTNRPVPTPPTGVVATRIQLFLEKITPLSKDLAAGGKPKAAALRKLRRLCETEVCQPSNSTSPTIATHCGPLTPSIRPLSPALTSISSSSVTWP